MKRFRYNKRKGFTLVECVIAIAVFAIMTSMVLTIVVSTVKLSKDASDSEAGLNQLVENVVQDNSNKVYIAPESKTLDMAFTGAYSADFAMTYSTIDGSRNLFKCPVCGYMSHSINFMDYLYSSAAYTGADEGDKKKYKINHWFNPATDYYECPECGAHTGTDVPFRCLSCNTTMSANGFIYDDVNGGYYCSNPACGSGKVVQMDLTTGLPLNADTADANYDFKVSGIQANAIRYGYIEKPEASEIENKFFAISSDKGTADGFTANLTYAASSDKFAAGVYTLTITSVSHLASDETATINITFPGAYVVTLLPTSTANTPNTPDSARHTDGLEATWSEPEGRRYTDTSKRSTLNLSNVKNTNYTSTIQFTLTNWKNNQSFDVDYSNEGGLMSYWFNQGGSGLSYTRPATP